MKATPAEMKAELIEVGAERKQARDRFGDIHFGWWLDGVYLGETVDMALEAIKG